MKTKKKGFSLVELICTLTIAAIIAVAAAPNVSAYILNSKIQNYQTALNNLVDELQTQLPQTRYWNWQEVQDNAAEILGSDITRNISEPEIDGTKYTYTLSNVSTDSDVQFKLSIDYGTPSLTKQDITISGECVGYDAVKSENNTCTVLLKSNFVDKDNYPKLISTINVPLDSSGWKPMKNMGGTYSYWEPYNLSNKDNDFAPTGEIPDKNSDAFYLNLTDYPAGACEQIIFTMQRYQVKVDSSLTEIGYVDDSGNWVATYGYNEGDKYTIIKRCYYVNCKGEEKNLDPWDSRTVIDEYYYEENGVIYILPSWFTYIGETWFNGNLIIAKKYTTPVIVDSAEYTCIKREYNAFDPVYPRMQTQDSKGTGAQYAINSDYSNLEVCVGTDTNGDDIWAKYSDVFDLSTYWLKSTPQADKYRTYYGDDIELGTPNGATRYWSTDSGKSNIYIKYRVSDIPASTRGWLYITGMVYGNQDRYINPVIDDTLQAYINYHRDAPDYDPSPILMATESGNFWNNYYKKLWLDISKCGYCVDNKLKITLKNVDANAIINAPDLTVRCATPNMQAGYGLQNLTDYGRDWLSSHTVNGNIVPTYDFNVNNARFTFSEIVSVKKVNASTVEIRIDATWDLYPYIYLYFPYANENFTFDMDLSMEWEDGDAEFSEETTTSNIPAVTVNGNDKYAILTFDWSKCDYITQRNIGNMHLEFSQPLNYIVYNKDYTPLNYYFIYSKQYFYPIQIADSVLKTNILDSEKLVHLYFDGISADEIKYQIKDCPSPPSTGETPAPSTPETPIIPDAPVKPVVPEEPEVPEVPEEPEEVEEQNLTLHYIYAGKKYTTVYYDSFSSLTGQPANSVTYTESTNHNVIFKKTDSILYFYPALGENDSPSSSDWMSISYDYIKTHNIHDLYIKGGVVYISDPGPDYLEYEVTLVKDILKNKCKKATAFVVHDMKEFTLSEMVDREKNGLVTDAKLETNGTCKAYLWNEGSVVHFWSDADTVYMPQDCSALFYESTIAGTLDLSRFSFAKVTDASQMFCKTRNLSSISFSQSVNVLNVTSMAEMFFESGIVNADLSGFVTSNNLQYMNSMFFKCPNLTNITFGSEFDTSGVTSFNSLFAESKKLETINIEELETNSVTDMSCAFNECKALQSIDLSTWNFGNVEFANKMFGNCKGLTAINFGDNIDASKVITFKDFFAGSDKIVSVNISKWNISDNANVDGFFKWCSSLQTAYVSQKFYDLYSTASNNEKLNKCIVQ